MNEMTHETCSELLAPYLRGELERARAAEVERHLAACDDCSHELAGLSALLQPEIEPLNEVERARILRAVRAGAAHREREPLSQRWGRRLAPALGAAALLAIIAVGVITISDEDPSSLDAGADVAESDQDTELFDAGERAGGGDAATAEAAREKDMAANAGGAQPQAESMEATQGDTTLAASAPFVMVEDSFASARFDPSVLLAAPVPDTFDVRDAARRLAASAPDARLESRIRECATAALASSETPLLPTYASYFTRDDVLLIGFVRTEPDTGATTYVLRGWRGAGCDRVSPIYRTGKLP